MSIFEGIRSWFQSNKYKEVIESLKANNAEISFLLDELETKEEVSVKEKIRKKLELSKALIEQLKTRYNKAEEEMRLLAKRFPEETNKFIAGMQNLSRYIELIYSTLRKERLTSKDKELIMNCITKIIPETLENLNIYISRLFQLKPKTFKRSHIKMTPWMARIQFKTRDGIEAKKIIKMAIGFDFPILEGKNHPYLIDFHGGQPAAVAKSTIFERHIIPRMERATRWTRSELMELMKTL